MRSTSWYSRSAKSAAHFCGRTQSVTRRRSRRSWADELVRATHGAHNPLLDLEELEEANLDGFRNRCQAPAAVARVELEQGRRDTGTPEA